MAGPKTVSLIKLASCGRLPNSDRNKRIFLRYGGFMGAVLWAIRTTVRSVFQVFLIDTAYGVNRPTVSVPFDAMSYDKANKGKILGFIMFREATIHMGGVILFIVLMCLPNPLVGLYMATAASLLYLLF